MKRSFALPLAAALLASVAGAEPPAEAPGRSLPVDLGAQLFVRYCASCHGVTGVGDGPVARALSGRRRT